MSRRPNRSLFVLAMLVLAPDCTGMVQPSSESKRKLTRGDLGIVFRNWNEAAKAACAHVWKHERRATRIEYCGAIYRDAEGIKAGLPETNWLEGRCYCPFAPPGTELEACYHNHKLEEEFSRADRTNPTLLGVYLCAPSGLVKLRTAKGSVIVN